MLSENKFTKYAFYAIGEIFLVVIGILIALQINNAKEAGKTLERQITILENIKSDMVVDRIDIDFNLKFQKLYLKAESDLLNFLLSDVDKPKIPIDYNDALGVPLFSIFHTSSFNNLQNNDIGLISNNQLYKKITRYYDFFEKTFSIVENESVVYNTYSNKLPYFKRHFKIINQKITIVNPETDKDNYVKTQFERHVFALQDVAKMKSDEAFKMTLSESAFVRSVKVKMYQDIVARNKKLVQIIDDELVILKSQ